MMKNIKQNFTHDYLNIQPKDLNTITTEKLHQNSYYRL
jgi:hypothetical protein